MSVYELLVNTLIMFQTREFRVRISWDEGGGILLGTRWPIKAGGDLATTLPRRNAAALHARAVVHKAQRGKVSIYLVLRC